MLSSLKFGRMEGLLKQGVLATKCGKFWNLYDIIVKNQDFYFNFFAMVLFFLSFFSSTSPEEHKAKNIPQAFLNEYKTHTLRVHTYTNTHTH